MAAPPAAVPAGEVQVLAADLAGALLVAGVAPVVPSIGWSPLPLRLMVSPAKPLTRLGRVDQWFNRLGGVAELG